MFKSYVKLICFLILLSFVFIVNEILFLIVASIVSLLFVRLLDRNIKKVSTSLLKLLILSVPILLILWTLFTNFETAFLAAIKFSSISIVSFSMISCFELYETFRLLSNIFPYKFSFIIILCIRYMGMMKEDMTRINLARKARGFEDKGNILKKVRAKIDLIVPVFVDSLLKAEDITCSLESKCFGLYNKRTFWKDSRNITHANF